MQVAGMKLLLSGVAVMVALLVWAGAVVDYLLAKISELPRPYLVPERSFLAAYHGTRAFLRGKAFDFRPFRIRDYPPYRPRRDLG